MHYILDFPNKEAKMYMGAANQLICQFESIHHLRGAEPYTHLMIDESQLLFLQVASGTLTTKDAIKDMWETLTYHIRNAKFVRFYGEFMGRITIDVLKGLDVSNASVVCMPAKAPNNGQTMYIKSVARNMKQAV
jgi:hypothetical protein